MIKIDYSIKAEILKKRQKNKAMRPKIKKVVRQKGFEPLPFRFVAERSIQLSYWRICSQKAYLIIIAVQK